MTLLILAPLSGCGDDGDSNGAGGETTVVNEGSGEPNVAPLYPLTAGSVRRIARGTPVRHVVKSRVEIAPGRIVTRVLITEDVTEEQQEQWLSTADGGVWLEGSHQDGLLPGRIMLVPAEARVGMKWHSSAGADFATYTFEVKQRVLVDTVFGTDTPLWLISQSAPDSEEELTYRIYAEGYGLIQITPLGNFDLKTARVESPYIVMQEDSPVVPAPIISLETAPQFGTPQEGWLVSAETIRAAESAEYGIAQAIRGESVFSGGNGWTAVPANYYLATEGGVYRKDPAPFTSWITTPLALYGQPISSVASVALRGTRLSYTGVDVLMLNSRTGGLNVLQVGGSRLEEDFTDLAPGVRDTNMVWGDTRLAPTQILQAHNNPPGAIEFATVADRGTGKGLWVSSLEPLLFGKQYGSTHFESHVAEHVSVVTTEQQNRFYLTSPGGFIEQLTLAEGKLTRELLGRVELPSGQRLDAAIAGNAGELAVITSDIISAADGTGSTFWTGLAEPATPYSAAPTINLDWEGFDVEVCWQGDGELDAADWSIGQVPVAAVVPMSPGCALLVRDVEVTPVPHTSGYMVEDTPGWRMVEGTLPGGSKVRAFSTDHEPFPVFPEGTWLEGGGFISDTWKTYSPGGFTTGIAAPGDDMGGVGGLSDPSGAGLWTAVSYPEFAGNGTFLAEVEAVALLNHNSQVWPNEVGTTRSVLQEIPGSGGVLLSATTGATTTLEHRTQEGLTELTLPAPSARVGVIRDSGEVCGSYSVATELHLFCQQANGSASREFVYPLADGVLSLGLTWAPFGTSEALITETLAGSTKRLALLNLDTLQATAYPALVGGAVPSIPLAGPNQLYISRENTFVPYNFGFLTRDGWVPVEDVVDWSSFSDNTDERWTVTGLVADDSLLYVRAGLGCNAGQACNGMIYRIPLERIIERLN